MYRHVSDTKMFVLKNRIYLYGPYMMINIGITADHYPISVAYWFEVGLDRTAAISDFAANFYKIYLFIFLSIYWAVIVAQ